jgi:hypothetical protein
MWSVEAHSQFINMACTPRSASLSLSLSLLKAALKENDIFEIKRCLRITRLLWVSILTISMLRVLFKIFHNLNIFEQFQFIF